jgi:tetratricopeptide (TPR) repeat protein
MRRKIYLFGVILGLTTISCNIERVFNPSLPTYTIEQLTNTPLPPPPPSPTPIPTPEPGARIESGDLAYFYGDWEKAINEYTLALESNTDSEIKAAALLGLGRSLHEADSLDLAKDSLLTAIDNYPQSPLIPAIYFA